MKRSTVFSIAMIMMALGQFLLTGCQKKDVPLEMMPKDEIANCFSAIVTAIELPEQIQAGQAFVVKVEYMKPTPCDNLQGFQLQRSRNVLNLDVCLLLSSDPCITVIEMAHAQFSLTLYSAGTYVLRFKGAGGDESISVVVNP